MTSRWPILALLCAGCFIAVLDTTIVTVALPSVQSGVGFTASTAPWLLNGYAVAFGGLLLLLGRLGDRVGRRRVFGIGLTVFVIGSAVAGAATQPWMLVVGRFLQGAGAAAFIPASLSLLTTTFTEGRERSRALSAYASMAGVGFVAGMVGGGLLTEVWGWRWVFWVNVPIALVVLALTRLLPDHATLVREPLDVPGAAMLTGGLVLLLYGMTAVPERGLTSVPVVLGISSGLTVLTGFVVVERRHPSPLVPMRVLLQRQVVLPNAAVTLESMVGIGWLYLLSLYFQQTKDMDPLETGLLFVPMTVASLLGAGVAGWSTPRWGVRLTATTGLGLVGSGLAVMVVGVRSDQTLTVVLGMVVGETGFMLANVPLTLAGTAAVEAQDAGLAAGALNTSMQLGGACGLALVAVVAASTTTTAAALSQRAIELGLVLCLVAFCLPALAVALVLRNPDYLPPDR